MSAEKLLNSPITGSLAARARLSRSIRQGVVFMHRWVGLLMAVFLILVGLTGSFLAFKLNIDRFLNPELFASRPSSDAKQIDLATLADLAEKAEPKIRVAYFNTSEDRVDLYVHPRNDPATGKPFDAGFGIMYLDPWTGVELGHNGNGESVRAKIIPFIYDLHTNMAAGSIGSWTLGIVALAWTLDGLYAIYLTFPVLLKNFFSRWLPAWKIKWSSSAYRMNFDLHRASGLWFAPLLFIFAWSSVMFNLSPVYDWTTTKLFGNSTYSTDYWKKTILPSHPGENPKLNWHEAQALSQKYLDEISKKEGINIGKPFGLAYLSDPGVYSFAVESNIDISNGIWMGRMGVWVDGETGELQKVEYPTESETGFAIGTWLYVLHFANFHGWLAYRIIVCLMGIVMVLLSVTGIYIWWKKRRARVRPAFGRSA